jgi:hypothetical protein
MTDRQMKRSNGSVAVNSTNAKTLSPSEGAMMRFHEFPFITGAADNKNSLKLQYLPSADECGVLSISEYL